MGLEEMSRREGTDEEKGGFGNAAIAMADTKTKKLEALGRLHEKRRPGGWKPPSAALGKEDV